MILTIVTPCFNGAELIVDTVKSVNNQLLLDGQRIQYLIMDGESSDDTVQRAQDAWCPRDDVSLAVHSASDEGMYDALGKGLVRAEGDVISYLNAGDYYSPHAARTVLQLIANFNLPWLTGMRVTYAHDGTLISAKVPWRYNPKLLQAGYYGVRGHGRFLHQESTFWQRHLMAEVDIDYLRSLRLAGDLYLWTRFASVAPPAIVSAHLGGFRFHGNHLSGDMATYKSEAHTFLRHRTVAGSLRASAHEVLSWLPIPVRERLPGAPLPIRWSASTGEWQTGSNTTKPGFPS